MAVEGIKIDVDSLKEIIGNMKTAQTAITETLQVIQTEIQNPNDGWDSEAKRKMTEKFSEIIKKNTNFEKDLAAYIKYISSAVSGYETTEQKIKNNAEQFR